MLIFNSSVSLKNLCLALSVTRFETSTILSTKNNPYNVEKHIFLCSKTSVSTYWATFGKIGLNLLLTSLKLYEEGLKTI